MSVLIANVTPGTILIPDAGFDCLTAGTPVRVEQDEDGLFVRCAEGLHYLEDREGSYVGFSLHPILENRRKWIDFLKQPDTKKGLGTLVSPDNHEARCCLGHACHVLGAEFDPHRRTYDLARHVAPSSVMEALGLWSDVGGLNDSSARLPGGLNSLAGLNDDTSFTPPEIGAYLETVIMGGDNTPFKPITLADPSDALQPSTVGAGNAHSI